MANEHRPPNRLASERSPYLLQHAHNPVDWWPWGDQAFASARANDKPVFLSIGYSACHWCHVMERESFESEAIAKILAERFVAIKVDREERPDVDAVYQLAHQVLTQRAGGWPLSMFVTPDRKPFYGGTYFPNERRHGMPGFAEILLAVSDAWAKRRGEVDAQATELASVLQRVTDVPAPDEEAPTTRALPHAVRQILARADRRRGGFGTQPKFPNVVALELLATAAATRGDPDARAHLGVTLDRMARGGIYDHLGGGFARYSTDGDWLIPHFEKMLYDNALLVRAYVAGVRFANETPEFGLSAERCEAVVRETLAYVERQMTGAHATFYSAEDADSEGEEGKFYAWTPHEIAQIVGDEDGARVCAYFGVIEAGNFEHGASALWTPRDRVDVARELGITDAALESVIARARPLLFVAREKRVRPMLDDKCLASWNALMISALADAGGTLGDASYVEAAARALTTWRTLACPDGRLRHAIKGAEAYGDGFLEDVAGMCGAALDVYEAAFAAEALEFARALGDDLLARFWDDERGVMYFTPTGAEIVLHRSTDPHDHAYPGGVGLALDALLRLGTITGTIRYRSAAERMLGSLTNMAAQNPMGLGTIVQAADRAVTGGMQIVVLGDSSRADTREVLRAIRTVPLSHTTVLCARDAADPSAAGTDPAWWTGRTAGPNGEPVVYVCRGETCDLPARDLPSVLAALRRNRVVA